MASRQSTGLARKRVSNVVTAGAAAPPNVGTPVVRGVWIFWSSAQMCQGHLCGANWCQRNTRRVPQAQGDTSPAKIKVASNPVGGRV